MRTRTNAITNLVSHHWKWVLLGLFLVALALRMLLFAAWYTDDLHNFESGDYALYRIGAEHFDQEHDFSNSLFLVRPPAFSLMVWGLGSEGSTIILANALLGALIAPLTALLAHQLGLAKGETLAAGMVVTLDPAGIVYSTFLGPEPLANLTVLAAVTALIISVTQFSPGRQAWAWAALAGVALTVSFLTRPAPYLLWIALGGWLLITIRKHWKTIGTFAVICALGVGAWMLHNGSVFNHTTFSTIGPYTTVYYHAASVEHLATGNDMDTVYASINRRVEEHLGNDPSGITEDARHGYLAATPQVARALNTVAFEIFTENPLITLITFPIGFSRMYGITTSALSTMPAWVKALEIAWNTVFVFGTGAGLWWALRQRHYFLFWCVFLVIAYFTGGTLLVKSAGMTTRERSVMSPFMAISTIYAMSAGIEYYRNRSRRQTPQNRPA